MSVIAGIFNRRQDAPLDSTLCDNLQRAISRNPLDDVTAFRNRNVALFKIDVGAYGEPAVISHDSGSVSMLAGEPLLDLGLDAGAGSRSSDLARMHDAFDREQWTLFSRAQGVYCAVHYQPDSPTLTLVADRLGIRPIYYWLGQDYVIFASALRVLESLSEIPKVMDLVAVTEIAFLGYPVGNRTVYAAIHGLKAGQVLRVTQERPRSLRYWRWDSIKSSTELQAAQLEEAYDRFRHAVKRRLRRDTAVFAALSGGLDSRCVVAALRSEAVQVHTINFYGALQSQDRVFAAEFARRAGTIHRAVPSPVGDVLGSFEERVSEAWRAAPPSLEALPERPQMLWMGDGGSVGLGHVFVGREVVAALRARDADKAIGIYRSRLVPKVLKSDSAEVVTELVADDIRTELADLRFDDPGRSLHMFLMLYEQRYDFMRHSENVDLHRLEFQLPFFDGDFLASIVSAPLDWCLDHGFYTDWLSLFPPAVTAVPWQAYPGHRPCPLPIPSGLANQWDQALPASEVAARRRRRLHVADQVLQSDRFPDAILTRPLLQLARWLCKSGSSRGDTTIASAEIYDRYWTACGGKFVAKPSATLDT